jgi:putative DNA methylase
MNDTHRLIEHAFPLKQASLDSVHEKNVRHGHISTLHIWPARRPLAACRAALIATLLPDPGTPEKRKELCEKIGGKVVKKVEKKKMPNGETVERDKDVTEGGILHWGREKENDQDLEWFRQEIAKAYGGRAPKVLDPFAGGGAIPLEAMRLGCDVTAVDINPVAWFILKCTLEYPQKLAGKTYPLPDFILQNENFMNSLYKAHPHLAGRTKQTKMQKERFAEDLFLKDNDDSNRVPKVDLSWHVRAWGQWVLDEARRELARFYPTYAEFEPLELKNPKSYEKQPIRLVPLKENGAPDIEGLNADFSKDYLRDKQNPRWVSKPTVAYLWARTVTCKNCRATIPLVKTRWLCKNTKKRVLLAMEPNADKTGVVFGIETNVQVRGGNTAQRREHDKRISAGTMSRSGAKCPCCPAIMTMEDIRLEGQAGRLNVVNTVAVVQDQGGKAYRLPELYELQMAKLADKMTPDIFAQIPFGLPEEPTPKGGNGASRAFSVDGYGFKQWKMLFTPRQLLALGVFVRAVQEIRDVHSSSDLKDAVIAYLACCIDRAANYLSTICIWEPVAEEVKQTFLRFALPITWDFAEGAPLIPLDRFFQGAVQNVSRVLTSTLSSSALTIHKPSVSCRSATTTDGSGWDIIVTDPPYYDAIPYSDLMDFFYIWLRRVLAKKSAEMGQVFHEPLSPKWDYVRNDGELIDDSSRFNGDALKSKATYEDGMFRAFYACHQALAPEGRMVIVFAHKQPDAWETLVSAMIRAGFVVCGSWPIATEMRGGVRNYGRASLSSSVWLVCRKRAIAARPGWDNQVLDEMRTKIQNQLREFWDAGIRGPDFVWAATGPALEAYSEHPVVKKANDPGQLMSVSEFLTQVRRMTVDFVVGRVLAGDQEGIDDLAIAERLDEPTAYYLLHRNDFHLEEAPAGACILYAISCGVSDRELADTWDLISFSKGKSADEGDDEEADADAEGDADIEEDSGSKVKLKTWAQRRSRSLGYEAPGGKPVPLIDRIHCLMHLWRAGELSKVDEYLDTNGLRRQELFKRLLQSLIELSPHASEERSLLESISNHVQGKGAVWDDKQPKFVLESREPS